MRRASRVHFSLHFGRRRGSNLPILGDELAFCRPAAVLILFLVSALTALISVSFFTKVAGGTSPAIAPAVQSAATAAVPGQSTTQLPDGRLLLVGGNGPSGPLANVFILDSRKTSSVAKLTVPRAWHSATVLPDGKVLIFGGVEANGDVASLTELFNPITMRFERGPDIGATPRAYHTATLLIDGRVLFAGGQARPANPRTERGDRRLKPIHSVEAWHSQTNQHDILQSQLDSARIRHQASLLPDGGVFLWGGVDDNDNQLSYGVRLDPNGPGSIQTLAGPDALQDSANSPPYLVASIPSDRAVDVPVEIRIALQFSRPLEVRSVNADTIKLRNSLGDIESEVVPAEGGRLAFVSPLAPLQPGMDYTLSLGGSNSTLPAAAITFSTTKGKESRSESELALDSVRQSQLKLGALNSKARSLPPLQAVPGETAVSGQVLALDGNPLAHVTLELAKKKTRTDDTGRFLLTPVPGGHQELKIDGHSASKQGRTYGFFEAGLDITSGQTNVLPFTIWMPEIDTAHAVKVSSPTASEVVVRSPYIPGLELHIPAHTDIRDEEGKPATEISITPIPVDQPPFPLPPGVEVPVYFTIQPGGAYLKNLYSGRNSGAYLVYPNYTNQVPGTRFFFWHYDPEEKGWYVYGRGTVRANGSQVDPDPGTVIYEFTGAMINTGNTPPPKAPKECRDGDPVDLATGLFVNEATDLYLPDVIPLALTRAYRNEDGATRDFGIGSTHPYNMFLWSSLQYQDANLILPDGQRIHYLRISGGTGFASAVFENTDEPGEFFKSQIKWNGTGWDLTRKDGMVYVFGDNAPLQSMRDRYGNQVTVTRTGIPRPQVGPITKVTSPSGRYIQFSYDGIDRVTQAKDNAGRTVNYTYDASGRLWRVTDPNNGVTEYTYNSSHRMLTIKNPRQIVFLTNEFDLNGRAIKQTHADQKFFQFGYTVDGQGNITQTDVTGPGGDVRRVTFGSCGCSLTDTYALGRPEQQTTAYEHQVDTNLVLSVTDALNRKTSYAYDTLGNITSVTRLAGTAEAVTTTYTYEPRFNRVATVTDPLTHTTTFAYDIQGNLITMTDPLNRSTSFSYNGAGQLVSVTDALQYITQFGYTGGDLVRMIDPLNRTLTSLTDAAGRLISVTDPLGNMTRYEYDGLSRMTRMTDPLQGLTQFSYDPNKNLLSLTDARNNTTSYTYDNMDRVITRRDPLQKDESYQHNDAGELSQVTDRKAQVRGYSYDFLQRLKQVTYGDSSTTTYTYDGGNRLTQVVDSISGTITRTYDNLDRLTSEVTPQGTVSYTYDAAGRRASMTVLGQPTITYTYDNADRLTAITQASTTVTFGYDEANRRTSLTVPSGVLVEYGYDNADQLTSLTYKQGTTVLGNLTYEYDLAGGRTKMGGSFARTGLPQGLSSATYNAANQQMIFGSQSFVYDANGNVAGDGARTYIWNARNQLVSINSGVTTTGQFQYDAFGRRTNKTIGGTTRGFFYDGANAVQELSGAMPTANLLAGGVDENFIRTDASGSSTFLLDGLGSTLAMLDAAGSLQTQYTYEPFGKTTSSGSSGNSAQFTGRENDGTGLYYYRARYYHPTLQRFISEDPLASQSYLLSEVPGSSLLGAQTILAPSESADTGSHEAPILALAPFVIGQNTYAYVMNRPTILTDSSGESPALVRALQIAAAAAARYGKQAAKFCRNVRCKIELHDAHHPFGFPFYEKRRHVQLTCWIKGQKGSTFILRIPY